MLTDNGAEPELAFRVGQIVCRNGGWFGVVGVVVAAFRKISGEVRYVVERPDGGLLMFAESGLFIHKDHGGSEPC